MASTPMLAPDDDAGVDDGHSHMAHNVILLLADGVGPTHWQAARLQRGGPLALDSLVGPVPYATDSSDRPHVTDSAAAATAIATGGCTYNGRLAVGPDGTRRATVLELAQARGKATGVLTNTVMLDASPMAFASHAQSRTCFDTIAEAALSVRPDVWLGGALPASAFGSGRGLAERARAAGYTVVERWPLDGDTLPADAPLLGMFGLGSSVPGWPAWEWGLTPEVARTEATEEPSLSDLTRLSLARLGDHPGGFFLFIENEHPDTVGHAAVNDPATAARWMGALVLELDRALAVVLAWVDAHSSFDETLVVVASDHENGGYRLTEAGLSSGTFPASPEHTSVPVPAYAKGVGSEQLGRVTHLTDLYYLLLGQPDAMPRARGCPGSGSFL